MVEHLLALDPQSYLPQLPKNLKTRELKKFFFTLTNSKVFQKSLQTTYTTEMQSYTLKCVYSSLMPNNHDVKAIQVSTGECTNKREHITTLELYGALKSILLIINCRLDTANHLQRVTVEGLYQVGLGGMSVRDCPHC